MPYKPITPEHKAKIRALMWGMSFDFRLEEFDHWKSLGYLYPYMDPVDSIYIYLMGGEL
jgi:hypothetical protein